MLDRFPVPIVARLTVLEELYDAHHRLALGLARRILRNPQDAEEVVQEAFLSVWRTPVAFDSRRGSTRTWLLTVVRNRALDVLRARKRRPHSDSLDDQQCEADLDVATLAVVCADRESVLYALDSLPSTQRQVLELAYFAGLSGTEIARQLDVPVGTVKGRIRLALNRLRLNMAADSVDRAA